jgi:predicted nuclease with TOPRIM domain
VFFITSLCLNTLSEARKDADKLKDYITKTKSEFEEANETTAKLLDELTAKSTVLEKLKAKLGVGSDTLRSFIAMIDSEIEDDGSYLIADEEKDELDEEFERIQVRLLLFLLRLQESVLVALVKRIFHSGINTHIPKKHIGSRIAILYHGTAQVVLW